MAGICWFRWLGCCCCCCCFLWFLRGGEGRIFFVLFGFFLNDNVNLQPKQEDKIEPCPCCFDFVMNQQVGSFT